MQQSRENHTLLEHLRQDTAMQQSREIHTVLEHLLQDTTDRAKLIRLFNMRRLLALAVTPAAVRKVDAMVGRYLENCDSEVASA